MILNGHKVGNDGYSQGLAYGMMSLFSTLPFGLDAIFKVPHQEKTRSKGEQALNFHVRSEREK